MEQQKLNFINRCVIDFTPESLKNCSDILLTRATINLDVTVSKTRINEI